MRMGLEAPIVAETRPEYSPNGNNTCDIDWIFFRLISQDPILAIGNKPISASNLADFRMRMGLEALTVAETRPEYSP